MAASPPSACAARTRVPTFLPRLLRGGALASLLVAFAGTGLANNVGENAAWQFQTSADKTNQAAIQDMIQRKKAGSYGAASTTNNSNTYIGRQFNCDVNATAQGNQGSNSTVANSPSTSGANANSTGNDSTGWSGDGTVNTGQANTGTVGSQVNGSTTTGVQGWANQALNSNQTNSGSQSASVSGSTACAYGTLN